MESESKNDSELNNSKALYIRATRSVGFESIDRRQTESKDISINGDNRDEYHLRLLRRVYQQC